MSNDDDLSTTNSLDKVFEVNQENSKQFHRFIQSKNKYSNEYSENHINIYESNSDGNYISDTEEHNFLDEPKQSFYKKNIINLEKENEKFKLRKTYVNIDSRQRQKLDTFNILEKFSLEENPFISSYQSHDIIIKSKSHPFQPKDIGKKQVIFKNVIINNPLEIGINKGYLEYIQTINNNFFIIKDVILESDNKNPVTGKYPTDKFVISLDKNINNNNIKTAVFGGENTLCYVIDNISFGYISPSFYKINLGNTFNNVYRVSLISSEIPNTSYTINSNKQSILLDGKVIKTKTNNKLKWINEEEFIDTYNISLYSDEVFFNTFNKNIFFHHPLNPTSLQKNYSREVWKKIQNNQSLLESFSKISLQEVDISGIKNNSEKDYYSPVKLHLDSVFRHPDTKLILPSTSGVNLAKYWLPNSFHNFEKTLLYTLHNSIFSTDLYKGNINNINDIYNSNILLLKDKNPYLYHYYTSILKKSSYDINFSQTITFKNIDSLDIPQYRGYFVLKSDKQSGINNLLQQKEFIEVTDIDSKYIYPYIGRYTEKNMSPILIPSLKSDNMNNLLKLKNYKRFPIYETVLPEGRYSKLQFINKLNEQLNNVKPVIFNNNQKNFNKINFNNNNASYDDNKGNVFRINLDSKRNFIDIRQYRILDNYKFKGTSINNNKIFYNEGIPYIAIKSDGHTFSHGDKIFIENANVRDGLVENEVNGEHKALVMPAYKIHLRIIYPLPSKLYLDQKKNFTDLLGENIVFNNNKEGELKFKRDIRKMCIIEDNKTGNNDEDINQVNDPYFGNYTGIGNFDNIRGNSNHSQKETYPLKTKRDNKKRFYGDFNNLADYKFGIFNKENDYLNELESFLPPLPQSLLNMDDGSLLHRLDNNNFYEDRDLPDTLKTSVNYFGSKLVNSINNSKLFPEHYASFLDNEVDTKGIQLGFFENEVFIKLSSSNNINHTTIIGRINNISNNSRSNEQGNYEIIYDLISEFKNGNFNIGDIIIGLESNTVAMIVPQSWNYEGLPINEVMQKGIGSYIIEKYRNFSPFIRRLLFQSRKGNSNDLIKFNNHLNFWEPEIVQNSEKYIYIKIDSVPNKSRIQGILTSDLKIYKPVNYKFLFDEDDTPINELNFNPNQSFSYSQNNLEEIHTVNINKSYLLGIYKNSKSNFLVLETNDSHIFNKNDKVYIKNHKLYGKFRNNFKKKTLHIENIEPFRSYLEKIKSIISQVNPIYLQENNKVIPFKNVNTIYDYKTNSIKYSLGNDFFSNAYLSSDASSFEIFNNGNLYNLGIRERLINWFFENPYLWNGNNIEKTLEFKKTYQPSLINKSVIIKLIVSPFDSFGRNIFSDGDNNLIKGKRWGGYASKNGRAYNDVILREPPYSLNLNGQTTSFSRNSENVHPFLSGMGVYVWQNDKGELQNIPTLIGHILDTSLISMTDYIDNYYVPSYIHMYPRPYEDVENIATKAQFAGTSLVTGLDYSVSGINILNSGSGYTDNTQVIFPEPYSLNQLGNTININIITDNLVIEINFSKKQILFNQNIEDIMKTGWTPDSTDTPPPFKKDDQFYLTIVDKDDEVVTGNIFDSKSSSFDSKSISILLTLTENPIINDWSIITDDSPQTGTILSFFETDIVSTFLDDSKTIGEETINYKILEKNNFSKIEIIPKYNYHHKGKKAEGKAVIKNGEIVGIDITESGGGYRLNSRINSDEPHTNNILQSLDLSFTDIDGGGQGAQATIYLQKSAPTYAVYIKLSDNMFTNDKGNIIFDEERIKLLKRGNDIYFNSKYMRGDGKTLYSGFDLNTDENPGNTDDNKNDFETFGNYYWRNRTAAATIYQGYLTYQEDNQDTTDYYVSGHLEYFYKNFLQNKCVITYSQPFSKEELAFFNNHQIPIYNKKLQTGLNSDINNYNTEAVSNRDFIPFINRETEINPEVFSIHSFEPNENIYIYDNTKLKVQYKNPDSTNPNQISDINTNQTSTKTNTQYEYEKTGIDSGTYKSIVHLWNGEYNNKLLFNQTNSNKNILTNIEFNETIEKGFMNKGKIRVKGQQSQIIGNNSEYYNLNIEEDMMLENQLNIFATNDNKYNIKGSQYILVNNSFDTEHERLSMIQKNDIIIIGSKVFGKDTTYPSSDINKTSIKNSELSIVENIIYKTNGSIEIKLKSKLIYNHFTGETVISRYYYGELTRNLKIIKSNSIDNLAEYKVYITKTIYDESYSKLNKSNQEFYSQFIAINDVIIFDWGISRFILNYDKGISIPYDISNSIENALNLKTTQFNRIKNINYNFNQSEIEITLEKIPFIKYDTYTTFIILRKNRPKLRYNNHIELNNIDNSNSIDINHQKSVKYSNIATQPFIIGNKWYTKIFYRGKPSLNTTFKKLKKKNLNKIHDYEQQYLNNNILNNWTQGVPAYNSLSSKKVYIRGMKGITIPYMPVPSKHNNFNQNLDELNSSENIIYCNPVKDGEYITQPIINEDYNSYLVNHHLTINGKFENNFNTLNDYYNEDDVSNLNYRMDKIISNYNNYKLNIIWKESDIYSNYNYIVIPGIHLGYGGFIEERTSETNNFVNSVDGFRVIDIDTSSNKNKLIIDLEESDLDLNIINSAESDIFTNRKLKVSPFYINKESQFQNLSNEFLNTFNIGEGGTISLKKIKAPIQLDGENYIYLCCKELSSIKTTSDTPVDNIFSKILLPGESNKILYNTFIPSNKIFTNKLLPKLDTLEIAFITSENNLFDFYGLEHSFTLEITEFVKQLGNVDSISGFINK